MPKFLGNRVGYATSTSSDGGLFNLHSQQIFLRLLEKWPPTLGVSVSIPQASGNQSILVSSTRQRYVVFNSTGTFTISGSGYLHYTIVAGGGGGGTGESDYNFAGAGGGGAGGFRSGSIFIGPGTYTATIGGGGNGGSYPPSSSNATNGSPSSISGPSDFTTIESTGGGLGGTYIPRTNGGNGGSGGGGGAPYNDNRNRIGGDGNTPSFTPPQGNPGGTAGYHGGAGGGGAGSPGGSGHPPDDNSNGRMKGGNGGSGRLWGVIAEDLVSGLTLGYQNANIFAGGGGGGGGFDPTYATTYGPNSGIGSNGAGPGGSGFNPIPGTSPQKYGENGYDAASNTGGGGGGGSAGNETWSGPNNDGGNGGSGIIIISHSY